MAFSTAIGPALAVMRNAAESLEEAVGIAGATLDRLLRDGADAEPGVDEARVAELPARRKDLETSLVGLAVLFDEEAERIAGLFALAKTGEPAGRHGLLRFRHGAVPPPDATLITTVIDDLGEWLVNADRVLSRMDGAGKTLKRCHAAAEALIDRVVRERGTALAALEAAQRKSEEKRPELTALRFQALGIRDEAKRAEFVAQNITTAEAAHGVLRADEEVCLATFQRLDALQVLTDSYLETLNGQIAAQNTIAAKLSADAERCIHLRGAARGFLDRAPFREDVLRTAIETNGPLGGLLASADKGLLSHPETMRRKDHADTAFALKFMRPVS